MYFVKNGNEVGMVDMKVPGKGLYPTIGLGPGDHVIIDFGAVTG